MSLSMVRVSSWTSKIPVSIRYASHSSRGRGGRKIPWKPAAFTLLVGASSYSIGICLYERKRNALLTRKTFNEFRKMDGTINRWITKVKSWWKVKPYHDRFFYSILSLNTFIFLCWRLKRVQPFMLRHFTCSPQNSSTPSLLLSSFSHVEVWHFAINMFVMWSFMPPFISIVGQEGSWPFYLTAGTFASMIGYYAKVMRGLSSVPSVGASGALMAIAALVISHNPDASLYLIFLPFIPIPAYTGLTCIVTLDIIGLIRGWRLFDHAAHLGGVAFGIYYYWGNQVLRNVKKKLKKFVKFFT